MAEEPDGVGRLAGATYRSVPVLLNLQRDHRGTIRLASTWSNLGSWDGAFSFADACAALARILGKATPIHSGDVVLDVGVGYADQAVMWAREFGASRVVCAEADRHIVDVAMRRLNPLGLPIKILASAAPRLCALVRSLAPPGGYDVVLCLDAAYHFSTRADFLRVAGSLLRPGGAFGAVDLVTPRHSPRSESAAAGLGIGGYLDRLVRRAARRILAAACSIDPANLVDADAYAASLADAGFDPDHTRIVSLPPSSVFLPLAAYAWAKQRELRSYRVLHVRLAERAALMLVGAIMWVVGTFGLLEAVVVTARRRA